MPLMKPLTSLVTFCLMVILGTSIKAQVPTSSIIELGKIYNKYMFMVDAPKDVLQNLKSTATTDSEKELSAFVAECIVTKNKILSSRFTHLPSDDMLKAVYMMSELSYRLKEEGTTPHEDFIDSLQSAEIDRRLLISRYYHLVFTANGNKNKPFNMSKSNFILEDLGLKTDTEKGIFVLRCMASCGSQIWGFINIAKPPNTTKAMSIINKFPKIDNEVYFHYTDFYFDDFLVEMDDSMQSFKSLFVHDMFDLLLNHLICLDKEGKKDGEIHDLLLSSILRDKKLYKYTSHQATLERIFQKQ